MAVDASAWAFLDRERDAYSSESAYSDVHLRGYRFVPVAASLGSLRGLP